MQKVSVPTFSFAAKAYYSLTKPGIIMGNAITAAAGFALASRGQIDSGLFFATLLGISLIIASACVCNNYIDRNADEKMQRTKNRALALGVISVQSALTFAIILGMLGALVLSLYTNLLTVAIALVGFFVYVVLYSFSKYHSVHGTLIGSIAGAVPPVVGYCAVSNRLDAGALILFAMIALWQMPHFFAIAIYRLEDYIAASIPVLPIKKGMLTTKIHMLLYIIAFIGASLMLFAGNYVGYAYLIVATLLGLTWAGLCIKGLKCDNDTLWARQMFLFSLIIITGISIVIPFSV
jgi:protoheme IX farnesyltransferase